MRARLAAWGARGAAVLAVLAISELRPRAAALHERLKVTSSVYALPSPEQTVVASLGYRAPLADLIFSHVLVSYGIHALERRKFEDAGRYLDTINALDPKFREPYRFADTLVVFGPHRATLEDYEKAREILRRGVRERPYDTELWLILGQFLAYLAPPYLPTREVAQAWRAEGGRALARACELASDNQNIPYHCVAAAKLLDKAGEREAAIESLKKLVTVTDDPQIQELALGYLDKKLSEREHDMAQRRQARFREIWKSDLPFVSKDALLALLPPVDPARCSGPGASSRDGCATSWRDWSERGEALPH